MLESKFEYSVHICNQLLGLAGLGVVPKYKLFYFMVGEEEAKRRILIKNYKVLAGTLRSHLNAEKTTVLNKGSDGRPLIFTIGNVSGRTEAQLSACIVGLNTRFSGVDKTGTSR